MWAGDHDQSGQFIAAFQSTWLSQDLLHGSGAEALTDALIRAARYRSVALHLNKGLAGADREAVARSRGTSTHPAAFESFALAIVGCASGPKRPGVPGYEPDLSRARQDARDVRAAIEELRALTDHPTAYLSECDYFLGDWMTACWGEHTERLRSIKRRFDPTGLFHVHHGIIV